MISPVLTPATPSRRGVLAAGALGLLALGGLSGCTTAPPPAQPPPDPDAPAVDRALGSARVLRESATALAGREPDGETAALLRRIAEVHEKHLAALGDPTAAGATGLSPAVPVTSPTGAAAVGTTAGGGAGAPASAHEHLEAEVGAARVALRDGEGAAPAFAVLLCRIAAARIVNADLLSSALGRTPPGELRPAAAAPTATAPTATDGSATDGSATDGSATDGSATDGSATDGSATDGSATDGSAPATGPSTAATAATDAPLPFSPPPPSDLRRLPPPDSPVLTATDRWLAGEHAAVYAYPLVVARVAPGRRALAAGLWQAHRDERDDLTGRLVGAGVRPSVAEPAYDVGRAPRSPSSAAALAGRVETGLAALATDLVAAAPAGATGADARTLGADGLVRSARRAAAWTGRPVAFPGGGDPTTASTTPTGDPSAAAGAAVSPTPG